jgi:hypothetical protein
VREFHSFETASVRVHRAPHSGRPRGVLLLGLGIAIEVVGTLALYEQDRNVYTINGGLTIPTWLAMLVGIALVASGYGRLLRTASPRSTLVFATAGAVAGALLFSSALAWQLAYGMLPSGDLDLDVYAALPLFFVGVAALTAAVAALSRAVPVSAPGGSSAPRVGSRALLFGRPGAVLAAGVGLVASSGATAGWLNSQAADVNSLYQFVALELAVGGGWLLLSGASTLLAIVPPRRIRSARSFGTAGGLVFILAGALMWWRTAPFVYALGEILLGGFLLAGIGLIVVSRPRAEPA